MNVPQIEHVEALDLERCESKVSGSETWLTMKGIVHGSMPFPLKILVYAPELVDPLRSLFQSNPLQGFDTVLQVL